MNISVLTIFPESFESFLKTPVVARAIDKGIVSIDIVDIKDYAKGSFRHIDDSPFGGGAGMVMRCQPVLDALQAVRDRDPSGDIRSVAMTPGGSRTIRRPRGASRSFRTSCCSAATMRVWTPASSGASTRRSPWATTS